MGIRLGRVAAGAWVLAGSAGRGRRAVLHRLPVAGHRRHRGPGGARRGRARRGARRARLDDRRAGRRTAVGLTATFAAGYQDQLAFLGRGFGSVAPYVVMLLVLLVRPSGLFGSREVTRV